MALKRLGWQGMDRHLSALVLRKLFGLNLFVL
jgi:hypothetical protein